MTVLKTIQSHIHKKGLLLFICFYIVSTTMYYAATWISWGTYSQGFLSFFNVEEFFAAAGMPFIVSFVCTIPIWWVIEVLLKHIPFGYKMALHIVFLPIFILACYQGQLFCTKIFGWAMFWGGNKSVWTIYNLLLFYLVQFAFVHIYTYLNKLQLQEKEKAALKEAALKSELIALKAQLNPHFLHNLFNSINATIPEEQESTRELIIQLSDLFRYQNSASQKEFVTIKEEIDFIDNYLQLMKVRLKEKLQYYFEIDSRLYANKITPMLLQPLVENAVTHGITTKIEPSTLHIKINSKGNKIYIAIEDTGVGIQNKEHALQKGLGLANTQKRLLKIYNSHLSIFDNFPTGTKISFTI